MQFGTVGSTCHLSMLAIRPCALSVGLNHRCLVLLGSMSAARTAAITPRPLLLFPDLFPPSHLQTAGDRRPPLPSDLLALAVRDQRCEPVCRQAAGQKRDERRDFQTRSAIAEPLRVLYVPAAYTITL